MLPIARRTLLVGSLSGGLATPSLVVAQDGWPNRPIRIVVPTAPGGPSDLAARLIADALSGRLMQRVIVENRTGSGVLVGTEAVARASPDGYTYLYSTITHVLLRSVFSNLNFDPVEDFRPVALVALIPMLLMVNKDIPARSLQELIAMFRGEPGRYSYGSAGAGSMVQLATELFLQQAGGLRVSHVPYRGAAPAMPDLLNGNITMFLNVASDGIDSVRRGATRGLAVSSVHRLPQLPAIPTFAEAGLPGYAAYTWHMIFAPAGTPASIVQKLNENVNAALGEERIQRRLGDMAFEVRSDSTPESAAQWMRTELDKWEPIVRSAGIRPD